MKNKELNALQKTKKFNSDLLKVGGVKAVKYFHENMRTIETFSKKKTLLEYIHSENLISRFWVDNSRDILTNSFAWSESPQGRSYWNDLKAKLSYT